VATEGIRVNAVRPGIIDTEIHASGGQPDRARELAPQVPMQRAGTADEVAQACCGCCRMRQLHDGRGARRERRALSRASAALDDHRHQAQRLAHTLRGDLRLVAAGVGTGLQR
jgi:hypothetical protein